MTDHEHHPDIVDGVEVPRRVVETDEQVVGTHQRSICVEAGAHLEIVGTQQGSVTFQPGSTGSIIGQLQGSLHVATGAVVTVSGRQDGSVHVARGGVLKIEPGGRVAGSLHNDGVIENAGTRGGHLSGEGTLHDLDGATVRQPVVKDGSTYYVW
jgi:hypothetical protein